MSRVYKVCLLNYPDIGRDTIICVKPLLNNWDTLKEEIFIRLPQLKNKELRISYEGKSSHFAIFFVRHNVLLPTRLT